MKQHTKSALIALSLILLLVCAVTAQTNKPLPTLRGDDAVKELQKQGQYDSLMDAVKAARKADGQTDEPPPVEDAVGQQAKLTAPDGAAFDQFGISVSISGDTAIIGARADDVGAIDQGSAYIFVRSGTAWSLQQKLTASDGAASDNFGISVSISGDTAIIGAYVDDVGTNSNQGSAYIFVRSGAAWSLQQKLTASDGAAERLFRLQRFDLRRHGDHRRVSG